MICSNTFSMMDGGMTMSGDSLYVDNTDMTINLNPGKWKIYTDIKLTLPILTTQLTQQKLLPPHIMIMKMVLINLTYIQTHLTIFSILAEADKNIDPDLSFI